MRRRLKVDYSQPATFVLGKWAGEPSVDMGIG
jgi:hypothetical protein